MKDNKKIVVMIIVIIGLVGLVIGVSYAYWLSVTSQETSNVIESSCLKLEIYDNTDAINLSSAYPMSEGEVSKLTPYEFEVRNTCNTNAEFAINLDILDVSDRLSSNYVAISFNNGAKEILGNKTKVDPIYKGEDYIAIEAYNLGNDELKAGETKTYTLKLWLDGSVESTESMNKQFLSKISLSAETAPLRLSDVAQLGDYVEMTPTSTSYSPSETLNGCSTPSPVGGAVNNCDRRTINPSELDLWRVIRKNDDGTIEAVSEYISSNSVVFYAKAGYLNYIGVLNEIAKQYENEKYTIGSRHMGYNGQTEYIEEDPSYFENIFTSESNSDRTIDNSQETIGGGDILYVQDTDLVQEALGTLVASKKNSNNMSSYWLASRYHYGFYNAGAYKYWLGRFIDEDGKISNPIRSASDSSLFEMINTSSKFIYHSPVRYVRPIIILKPDLKVTGSGTSEDHWVFID